MSGFDVIPSSLASLFSIIFALSIVLELRHIVSGYVLVLLGVFIVLFLVANEYVKVIMIKRIFSNRVRGSVLPFVVSFLLSVCLSSIGIWFWTNKTVEHKIENNVQVVNELNKLNKESRARIFDIENKLFESTQEYKDLNKTIEYWQSRKAMDSDELKQIRERLNNVQILLNDKRTMFNNRIIDLIKREEEQCSNDIESIKTMSNVTIKKNDKNDFISYIFLSLILITELAIIILNKLLAEKEMVLNKFISSNMSKRYLIERNLLDTLYVTMSIGDTIDINTVKYCPLARTLEWSDLTAFYNDLIGMGILSKPLDGKTIITNNVQVDNVQALTMFDNTYNKRFRYNIELNS